jgi:ribose 5-phosphate isomerase B
VLSLGARMCSADAAIGFAQVFLSTAFSGEPRHARRVAEIAGYEKTGELPPRPPSGMCGPAPIPAAGIAVGPRPAAPAGPRPWPP